MTRQEIWNKIYLKLSSDPLVTYDQVERELLSLLVELQKETWHKAIRADRDNIISRAESDAIASFISTFPITPFNGNQ